MGVPWGRPSSAAGVQLTVCQKLRDDVAMIVDPLRDAEVVTAALGGDALGEARPERDDVTRLQRVHVGRVNVE